MADKPRVLVLGGVGFVGRNLVRYLVNEDKCSKIRAVDKVPPQTAYLNQEQQAAFEKVEFKQGNLASPASIEKCFSDDDGEYDIVINCAAETKYAQTDAVYKERVYQLSMNCAMEAAKRKCKLFVELSTARVYKGDKKASAESGKLEPWTVLAKHKLQVEKDLPSIEGLNFVILRPAVVYGPSDVQGLTPRLVMGAVYKQLQEKMKLLWTEKLRINTVHVSDLARAIWFIVEKNPSSGEVFNIVDQGETNQEVVWKIVDELFGIKHGYHGSIMSTVAEKMDFKSIVEDVNEKHLQPWSDLCKKYSIQNCPLTPYLDQELLYNNSLNVDGSKLTGLGFEYNHPKVTKDLLRDVLDKYIEIGVFPKEVLE